MQFYNYIVPGVKSALNQGHIKAEDLPEKINTHDGREAYHCVYELEKRAEYKGYVGIARPTMGWMVLDFDSLDLNEAKQDLLKVWRELKLKDSFATLFFSGSKGFHLYIREEFFDVPHNEHTDKTYDSIFNLIKKTYALHTMDVSIYKANHKIRMPNSRHAVTGLYKIQISIDDLELGVEHIKECAKIKRTTIFTHEQFNERFEKPLIFAGVKLEDMQPSGLGAFGHDNILGEDVQDGSLFKEFKEKVCISRMSQASHNVGERHSVALILIADLFHTGVPESEALSRMATWYEAQGIADRFSTDGQRMVTEQYSGKARYNYSCYDNIKKNYCSGQCGLYSKLKRNMRATVDDLPPQAEKPKALPQNEEDKPDAHITIVLRALKSFDGSIIKQDKDLFRYNGTHWQELEASEIDAIKKKLHVELHFVQSDKLEKCFKMLLLYLPSVPPNVNMYEQNPKAANFRNGTLWLNRQGKEYTLTFKPHSPQDYLTNCLDVNYTEGSGASNPRFEALLEHYLKDDPERVDKLRVMKQVAGAMLMPAFPQIFFLLGESGSGKSTFVKLFFRLIGGTKVSGFIQPCDMHGFHLEGLIHKTINIHTDVNEHKPIPDEFFKSSGDRIPMQINRKGRKVVQSFLPAVHVFCANTLPPTQVKNQNVYDRRMTIVKLDHVVSERIDQFEELVFEGDTQALVEFAVAGLRDIVGLGGFYTKTESSQTITKAWQAKSSNAIQDFLTDITNNEVPGINLTKHGAVKRSFLFDKFDLWSVDQGNREVPIKKSQFYREIAEQGFRDKKDKSGNRVFEGFAEMTESAVQNEKAAVKPKY